MDKFTECFEKLFLEEYADLYQKAVQLLGDFYMAEDAVEEVFVTVICHYRWWTELKEEDQISYARKICELICKRMLKKRERVYVCEFREDMAEGDYSSVRERESVENEETLKYALSFLKKEDRDIFKDKYFAGLSNKDIARKYGIGEGVVAKRLQRGRETMYRMLK